MATLTTYTAGAGDVQFDVPFPYLRFTDLVVTNNNNPVTFTEVHAGRIQLTTPCTGGESILIKRVTDVTSSVVDFQDPSSITAEDLNKGLSQSLFAAEEIEYALLNLAGSGATTLPATTAADQFITGFASGGGFVWHVQTKAQIQTLLGITGGNIPAPVAGNKILTTQLGSALYQLSSPADLKVILGLPPVSLPDPTGVLQKCIFTNGGGTGYQFLGASDIASILNLGSASQQNYGTAANQVVRLDGSARLPAVDGSQLTGISPVNQYCRVVSSKASNLTTATDGVYRNPGAGLLAISVGPTGSAWASTDGTNITLQPGRYYISIEQYCTTTYALYTGPTTGGIINVVGRVSGTSGTMTPTNTYSPAQVIFRPQDTNPTCGGFIGATIHMSFGIDVTVAATLNFSVAAIDGLASSTATVGIRHTTLPDNTNCPASTRIHLWKIA